MSTGYYQKNKEKLEIEASERNQTLSEKEKDKVSVLSGTL